jgi:hypothetical protein
MDGTVLHPDLDNHHISFWEPGHIRFWEPSSIDDKIQMRLTVGNYIGDYLMSLNDGGYEIKKKNLKKYCGKES